MPIYMYVVRNQKVRSPVRVVVALPKGITKVRFRTELYYTTRYMACANSVHQQDQRAYVDRIIALYWKDDGTLITQTTVTQNNTDIDVPPNAAYVEWRIPSKAILQTQLGSSGAPSNASFSFDLNPMAFIDATNNITEITVPFVFICSAWDQPVSAFSAELPISVDMPFCHDCSDDFSVRSVLRSIYAVVTNAQNARLRAILLDSTKNMLVDCSWVNVGDVSQETSFVLCDETNSDLLTDLKANYPVARYIRIMIDRADPAGPLPAAMFSIYFSLDKGSVP